MAIIGRFIGVGKYIDSQARDLPGARRDATALWALFKDSITNLDERLLLDEKATIEAIREALNDTLKSATDKDSVIFYFAGHGTPDHKLVAYNTLSDVYGETTISIEELSELFKKSKAKSVLCILDCCFSGGITARVFENAPIPRATGTSIKAFAGEGQVFIAASDFDEPSYEIPTTGHGLFTKALLDILQSLDNPTDIQEIMSRVMEQVRADGSKLGLTQTPVIYGKIAGGLQLPKFTIGSTFATHFPELTGIKIGKNIDDLASFNIPREILAEWKTKLPNGLNNLQLEAINEKRILNGESLMIVAPTSSGKTFVGEIAAAKAISEGRKVVFLFPYRALTNEKFEYFTELYSDRLGMRVVRCTGDYSDQASPFIKGKYDIALLTYEMFLGLSVNNPSILNSIGLVVLDEAQFITDPNRGIVVELLLTQLNLVKENSIKPQLVTLSATVGDINHFNDWLDLKVLKTDNRPIPLTEGVLDRLGQFQYRAPDGSEHTISFLPQSAIQMRKSTPGAQDVIVPLAKKLITGSDTEKIIVFRSKRGSASGCAQYLAADLGLPSAIDEIKLLPTFDLSSTSSDLNKCFQGGTAFHNTDLTRDERSLVERSFRAINNHIRVLVSTTTVAAGINTPASTVILVEHEFPGKTPQPYTVAEYKNMAGRAGRLGFQEEGRSIMLAETPLERAQLFNKYIKGNAEPITSSFKEEDLLTWLLRLLAQMKQVSRNDAVRLLINTYGGYLKNRENPGWKEKMTQRLEELLTELISNDLLEDQDGFIRLTQLGSVCGQSTLSFESIIRVIDLVKRKGSINSIEEIMIITQALPEIDQRYLPLTKTETRWPNKAQTTHGHEIINLLRFYSSDTLSFAKRCKRVSILDEWINGTPTEAIEKEHSTNSFASIAYGDIRALADATRFNLRSVYQIVAVLLNGNCPDEKELDVTLKRIEVGIPIELLDLLNLPILERGDLLQLANFGIKSVINYWSKSAKELEDILGYKGVLLEDKRPI